MKTVVKDFGLETMNNILTQPYKNAFSNMVWPKNLLNPMKLISGDVSDPPNVVHSNKTK